MLTLLTPSRSEQNDNNLKVLWIEDKLDITISSSSNASECFAIWRVWRPDELASGLKQQFEAGDAQRGRSNTYNLPSFPFDGFLADFNLLGAGLDAESRKTPGRAPRPSVGGGQDVTLSLSKGATSGEDDLGDLACAAEAAGLTSAVLVALNFEAHPAVIVPYTAYPQELFRQRALVKLLAPPALVISHGAELDLAKEPLEKKLEQFAEAYRDNLPRWADNGVIHVPYDEKERLRSLAKSRAYGEKLDGKVKWQEQDAIFVDTVYGRRLIGCCSLWFTKDASDSSLTEIEAWLDRFPVPSPVYSAAVDLADKYWKYSETDDSRDRYLLSRLILSLKSHEEGRTKNAILADISLLCDRFGVDSQQALNNPKKVELSVDQQRVKPLLDLNVDEDVLRLSIFFLLTMEYATRWISKKDESDLLWQLRHRLKELNAELQEHPRNGMDSLYDVLMRRGYAELTLNPEEDLSALDKPVEAADIVLRLDPLPKQLITADDDFAGGRIGKALTRKDIKLQDLISGKGDGGLRLEERRALQGFALDMDFPPDCWPEWLRKGYV